MRKILSFLVAALLVLTVFLAGCTKEEALAGEAKKGFIVVGEKEGLMKKAVEKLTAEGVTEIVVVGEDQDLVKKKVGELKASIALPMYGSKPGVVAGKAIGTKTPPKISALIVKEGGDDMCCTSEEEMFDCYMC